MKKITLFFTMFVMVFSITSAIADNVNDPIGKWKFSAPTAPYGYEQGLIEINKEEGEYKATMSFTGMDYKFELEKVKYEEEKLSFSLYLEGENIYIIMKFTDKDKLEGKAIYSQGEVAIYADRDLVE